MRQRLSPTLMVVLLSLPGACAAPGRGGAGAGEVSAGGGNGGSAQAGMSFFLTSAGPGNGANLGGLAGADAVMTTASLIRNGPHHVITLVAGLEAWLERKGFASVAEARGLLALPADGDPDAAERGGYGAAIQAAKARYGTL